LPLYKIYQQKLLDLNACDFGDLILHCVNILENNLDINKIYSNNFKYIMVDEYQDTNFIQSKWLNLLAKKHKNICCVGDDDQSIYSWRGAEIKNFLISSFNLKPAWSDASITFSDFTFLYLSTSFVKIIPHVYNIKNYTTIF